jgi:F-type H+-transporting ATPase subunit epsilon
MFHLKLVTLTGTMFEGDVYEVLLPTLDGQIGILPNHMPLISVATTGVISVRKNPHDMDRQMDHYATYGGVIEFEHNNLRVIVDEADAAEGINEAEAQKAFERAKRMHAEAKDQVSLEHAQALIDRSAVRLQVANLHRRHRQR